MDPSVHAALQEETINTFDPRVFRANSRSNTVRLAKVEKNKVAKQSKATKQQRMKKILYRKIAEAKPVEVYTEPIQAATLAATNLVSQHIAKYQRPREKLSGHEQFFYQQKYKEGSELMRTTKLEHQNQTEAEKMLALSELMKPETEGFIEIDENDFVNSTAELSQEQLLDSLDMNSQRKVFDIRLPHLGPYSVDFTRDGRHLLIGGEKGHVASIDWMTLKLSHELQLRQSVKDVKWLVNDSVYAVAQKNNPYIYTGSGAELHLLKDFSDTTHLEYLPFHYLLAGCTSHHNIWYKDISTGATVAVHKQDTVINETSTSTASSSNAGKASQVYCMTQNPWNAVLCCGHANGTVSMWTPNNPKPVLQMLVHKAPIVSMAVANGGQYLVTSGLDRMTTIWDLRTFQPLHKIRTAQVVNALSLSQKNTLALGHNKRVMIWSNPFSQALSSKPYLTHLVEGKVKSLKFCPFEDVLGIGHSEGVSSMLVPGAGEANIDSMTENPFETEKQKSGRLVTRLLEKIPSDMICLDPSLIATPALRAKKDSNYKANVELDEKDLRRAGLKIENKDTTPNTRLSRDALRERQLDANKKFTKMQWFEVPEQEINALDRFKTFVTRKNQ